MKKGLIVVNGFADKKFYDYQISRLIEEFFKLSVEIKVVKSNEIVVSTPTCADLNSELLDAQFAIFLDKDKFLSKTIENRMKMFNSSLSIELCDDKFLTQTTLSPHNIEIPYSVSFPLCYSDNVNAVNQFIKNCLSGLNYPIVVKKNFGSLGKGVFLAKNFDELKAISNELKFEPHFYQNFVMQSAGRDVRLIVVGGKFVCAMQRLSNSDFRSNIELGGKGINFTPPKKFIEMAETVAKILKLDYVGVDLLFKDEHTPIFCEANSNAFFKGIEDVTKVNVAGIYAKYIYDQVF